MSLDYGSGSACCYLGRICRAMTFRPLSSFRNTQPRTVHIDTSYKGKVENSHFSAFPYVIPHHHPWIPLLCHLPSAQFSLLWRSAHLVLEGPDPHLVTTLRFLRWLSAPGFSRSGSPFLGVCLCFMVFLFLALLMVVAECLGRSFRKKHQWIKKWDYLLNLPSSPSNNYKKVPPWLSVLLFFCLSLSFLPVFLSLMGTYLQSAHLFSFLLNISPGFSSKS